MLPYKKEKSLFSAEIRPSQLGKAFFFEEGIVFLLLNLLI